MRHLVIGLFVMILAVSSLIAATVREVKTRNVAVIKSGKTVLG